MSTYSTITFLILGTYQILNICEAGPKDPWSLEDEEAFQGEICQKSSKFFSQLCNRYTIGRIKVAWDPAKLNGLACSKNLTTTLWSKERKQDEKVPRDILVCVFVTAGDEADQQPIATVGFSRGKDTMDAAEYTYNLESESWVPLKNHKDMLVGLDE